MTRPIPQRLWQGAVLLFSSGVAAVVIVQASMHGCDSKPAPATAPSTPTPPPPAVTPTPAPQANAPQAVPQAQAAPAAQAPPPDPPPIQFIPGSKSGIMPIDLGAAPNEAPVTPPLVPDSNQRPQ